MQVYPITGSPFQLETAAGPNGVTMLHLTARDQFNLNSAGLLAVVNQIYTYLNTGTPKNTATILRLSSSQVGVAITVDVSGCSYPVLTADVAGQVTALTSIVQTAADVTV